MGPARSFIGLIARGLIIAILLFMITHPGYAQTNVPNTAPYHPPCYPNPAAVPPALAVGPIPTSVTSSAPTTNDTYMAWTCNTSTGYVSVVALFKLSDVVQYVIQWAASLVTVAQLNAICDTMCTPLTAPENTFSNTLHAKYDARAVVQANGANKSRVVFLANADGTLGPQFGTSRVKVGVPCVHQDRLAGTSYFSVQGEPDLQNPGVTLGEVYALCTITLPTGTN